VRWTAAVGIATAWLSTPPLTWLLAFTLDMGAFGGWIALCLEIIVGAVIFWQRIERGGWLPAAERSRAELADEAEAELTETTKPALSPIP
jgi:MATE family multidrug resistance protein